LPDYVARFRAALRQATGRGKKVLVLDLDNSLWGGVIGDDGVDGLALGPGSPRGEAFEAFQAYAKALAARGVILAVCSKNDRAIAETGFSHAASRLALADFAAFECGWTDKVFGLRRIAQTLNLGLDAMVFADDNPAECALVRAELPEVAVVELGADPAEFVARLEEGYWFAAQGFSAEDFTRNQAYQARAQAAQAREEAVDLDGFLRGLDMQGRVFRADAAAIPRIAQLEGKTNQFNLTARRYDEAAIAAFAAREDALVIDSWLMSCRVFSRTLEHFMLRALCREAQLRGLTWLRGEYIPTPKNAVVADLFPRLGFTLAADGRFWACDVAAVDAVSFIAEI